MAEFDDRIVLITGANGGLGAAVTRTFLDAGARVVGAYHRAASPAPGHPRFTAIESDLTAPAGAAAAVEAARQRFGRLDALLHLVGGFAGGAPVANTDDATWTRMLDLNLNAAFYTLRAALPVMTAAGRGRA